MEVFGSFLNKKTLIMELKGACTLNFGLTVFSPWKYTQSHGSIRSHIDIFYEYIICYTKHFKSPLALLRDSLP